MEGNVYHHIENQWVSTELVFLMHQQEHMYLNVLQLKSKIQLETMDFNLENATAMAEGKFNFKGEIREAHKCMVQTAQARKAGLDFQ